MEEIKYPVRINKYLAQRNICSRKEADILIVQKKVKINNRTAVLGDKVKEKDNVVVGGFKKELLYLVFNKPKGIITHSPGEKEMSINDIIKTSQKVFPVGRLDKDSSGLIILTNDGRLTDKLLNPGYRRVKEYIVKTDRPIDNLFLKQMSSGVKLDDGYITKKCDIRKIDNKSFSIILTEGKKRQIRRMCGALGRGVAGLMRTRILNIELNGLKSGQFRVIKGKELQVFLSALGLVV